MGKRSDPLHVVVVVMPGYVSWMASDTRHGTDPIADEYRARVVLRERFPTPATFEWLHAGPALLPLPVITRED